MDLQPIPQSLETQEKSEFRIALFPFGISSIDEGVGILNGYSSYPNDKIFFQIEVLPEVENLLRVSIEYYSDHEILTDEDYDFIFDSVHNQLIHFNDIGEYYLKIDIMDLRSAVSIVTCL